MKLTCHSEFGILKSVVIKRANQAFIDDIHLDTHWNELNYFSKPNFELANLEYEQFENALKKMGATIMYLPKNNAVNMDSIYCRDAAIATDHGMILCNMGKAARKNEPFALKQLFNEQNIAVLGQILSPGSLEGGDVAWLDQTTLAVGQSYRTNEEGINQLESLLKPIGVEVIRVPLPHYKGPDDVFHLMSIFSPIDKDLAVVYSPLLPIRFRMYLQQNGYQLIEVPTEEFDLMGCNVLAIAPRNCLMVEGHPKVKKLLENEGCIVSLYKGEEISVKGGGGPTCLTRPIYRAL
ncbi:MAG: hypothetical protein IPO16_04175 [Saprospiraceae bacterium]|nr:hypothetical protein [Saprospiraceae bacterium]